MSNPDNDYEPIWISGSQKYPLYSMASSHIENALNRYKTKGYSSSWHVRFKKFWMKEFEDELAVREMVPTRDPNNGQFMNQAEVYQYKKAVRLILQLPPMKPPKPTSNKMPKPDKTFKPFFG